MLVIRLAEPAVPLAMPETSRSSLSLMVSLSPLIWGVTDSVRPTSLRSMVWNGLTEPLTEPVLVNEPVWYGTSWPTENLAS